ncbi:MULTISPECIES: hypothetical protein [Gemmobacter]|uniref:Uncharacterized protein n=1 Tax=Gemmobacter caeni TaxID=589035 RepID=A0A2T6B6L0_9RHOB|nr:MULTISPECIES: hypothetical protein [Gemmobacter]OJY33555.1 MAG: hypothetical protein BGP11_22025 [Rhodobacterales bacterium 65-51]PTX51684.1 hypothetical protein C8N34_103186 [Gemmobacter caeni]TWJ03812.1 hypothetical protein IQ03_00767 [Gemmobacter caeni]
MNRVFPHYIAMTAGLLAACPAMAEQWLVDCGGRQVDLGRLELDAKGAGPKGVITLSEHDAANRSFVMHVRPKDLWSEKQAAPSATLAADLTICPYLNGRAMPVKALAHTDEEWVFLGTCQGDAGFWKGLCG